MAYQQISQVHYGKQAQLQNTQGFCIAIPLNFIIVGEIGHESKDNRGKMSQQT